MEEKKIPFVFQVAQAAERGESEKAAMLTGAALECAVDGFFGYLGKFSRYDLPFVLAATKQVSEVLTQTLDEKEQELLEDLLEFSSFTCVQIDKNELQRQLDELEEMKEENND